MELAPEILAFRATLEKIVNSHAPRLGAIGGNLSIRIFDKVSWTIVTSGPRFGIHEGPTDDKIDFALACEEDLFADLISGHGNEIDLQACIDQGALIMDGDYRIYERFMSLATHRSMLDIRSAH